MQKIINVFFIVAMLLLATALPLNTAILDFRLFGTHEIGGDEIPIAETITFSEAVVTLKNGETMRYTSDSDTPLSGVILSVDSPKNVEKLALRFHSNTGKFEAQLPSTTITYPSQTDKTQTDNKIITTSDLVGSIDPKFKEYEVDLRGFYDNTQSGDFSALTVEVEGVRVANIQVAKLSKMKPMMKYLIDVPAGSKAVKLYFPDEAYEMLVPVHRFEPVQMVNYVGLYEVLKAGAKTGFGLHGKDAVAVSNDYWIENSAARVEYRSSALKNFKNPELMYEAVARTFGSYGKLKQTVVNVDRVQATVIDTGEEVAFYYPVQASTHTYVMEARKPANSETQDTFDTREFQNFLNEYFSLLSDIGYLPSELYRAKHTLDEVNEENLKKITVNLTFEKIDNLPLPEYLEVFLSLTLYQYPGIEKIVLNGTELPQIKAFNIEE